MSTRVKFGSFGALLICCPNLLSLSQFFSFIWSMAAMCMDLGRFFGSQGTKSMQNVKKSFLSLKNSAKCTKPRYWRWSADAFPVVDQCEMGIYLQLGVHRFHWKRLGIPSILTEIVISLQICHFKRFACFSPYSFLGLNRCWWGNEVCSNDINLYNVMEYASLAWRKA